MKRFQLKKRTDMGKELRKLRVGMSMPIDVVVENLKDSKVSCSKGTISKVERGLMPLRADILGALCLIYGVMPEIILFKYKK